MKETDRTESPDASKIVKQCCARLYESDVAKWLLGDSFHPGGLPLTERLGTLLALTPETRVLDVASGTGASAVFLAERFGCRVVGVDYSGPSVERANELARAKNVGSRVHFQVGDAEHLDFPDASFAGVVCECAFCTFPDKLAAAREFARVLRPGGRLGFSDLTRASLLPKNLESLLAWIACIADAQPLETYQEYLCQAGLRAGVVEKHDEALHEMVQQVRRKLLGAELMVGLKKLALPEADLQAAKEMAGSAQQAIQQGLLGYALITAARPTELAPQR
jgi:arsenite methyltransferase